MTPHPRSAAGVYRRSLLDSVNCKWCGYCQRIRHVSDFHKRGEGLQSKCAECATEAQSVRWARQKAINLAARAAVDTSVKTCSGCGTTKAIDQFHRRSGKCKPCSVVQGRAWRVANPAAHYASHRRWIAKHPERAREKYKRDNRRRMLNPAHVLHDRISNQVRQVLYGTKRGRTTESLLGYSFAELKAHLERQFIPGMTWGNYGAWHIDHIVPLSSFTITGPDDPELRRAWGLPNLRPLWAQDNLRKKNKRETLL